MALLQRNGSVFQQRTLMSSEAVNFGALQQFFASFAIELLDQVTGPGTVLFGNILTSAPGLHHYSRKPLKYSTLNPAMTLVGCFVCLLLPVLPQPVGPLPEVPSPVSTFSF